jgi:hypothetical protein
MSTCHPVSLRRTRLNKMLHENSAKQRIVGRMGMGERPGFDAPTSNSINQQWVYHFFLPGLSQLGLKDRCSCGRCTDWRNQSPSFLTKEPKGSTPSNWKVTEGEGERQRGGRERERESERERKKERERRERRRKIIPGTCLWWKT